MRNEAGVSEAAWLLSDGLGGGGGGGLVGLDFAGWWTEKYLRYGSFEVALFFFLKLTLQKWGMKIKQKNIASLWRRVSLAGRQSRERQR